MAVRPESVKIVLPAVRNFPGIDATIAGAASAALTATIEGRLLPVELSGAAAPAMTRSFANLAAAARERAYRASLAGRNTREASVAGYQLGESIGNYVAKRARAQRRLSRGVGL